ncbi:MAG: hypothetical protein OXE96_09950 [Gemmatimonadetes bacterium]|nr:hypothetical protein [Gemmatimonadota bacterium]
MNVAPAPTAGYIARFWSPLAATWIMIAVEGPFVAAFIARLPDAKINLAAYGVALSIAIVAESPVMMITSAITALGRDSESYRRLRLFSNGLSAFSTLPLCLLLIPTVFDALVHGLLNLPSDVATLTYGALWIYLPWAAAIGYRRLIQGVMIRAGKTRQIAAGTIFRLASMAGTTILLFTFTDLPGTWVGSTGLVAGVVIEAFVARWMGRGAVRRILATPPPASTAAAPLSYSGILSFYYPLALTTVIGLAAHPLVTFFMGRAQAPVESLAVLPVLMALSFMFRSLGISYQEAAIALLGNNLENRRVVGRFAVWLGLACSLGLALFAFTPLFGFWFESVSGLTPELAAYARVPAMLLVPLPGLGVWLSYQRGVKVLTRQTKAITVGSVVEVLGIAAIFVVAGWGLDLVGVTAAAIAFLVGRILSNLYLQRSIV